MDILQINQIEGLVITVLVKYKYGLASRISPN